MPGKKHTIRRRRKVMRGGNKQYGGSVAFPASFGGNLDGVNKYPLNTFAADPNYSSIGTRMLGGSRRGRKSRRTTRRHKMHGGNFIGGLSPMNLTLGGNMVMNTGTVMGVATMK